jgi:hypothetical protein
MKNATSTLQTISYKFRFVNKVRTQWHFRHNVDKSCVSATAATATLSPLAIASLRLLH